MRIVLLVLAALLSACATVDMKVNVDPVSGVDLSRYDSFRINAGQILSAQGYTLQNSPANAAIEQSIARALTGKGLRQTGDKPALLVNYVTGAQSGSVSERLPANVERDRDSGSWMLGPRLWSRDYTSGGMIIELRDAGSKSLVWRAFINGQLNSRNQSRELEAAIQQAFAEYPSRAAPAKP